MVKPYGGDVQLEAAPNAPTVNSKYSANNMVGMGIEWTWEKLLVRTAYNRALWTLDVSPDFKLGERRVEIFTSGLKADLFGLTLMSEFVTTRDLDQKKYDKLATALSIEAISAIQAGNINRAVQLATQSFVYRLRLSGSTAHYVTLGKQLDDFFVHTTYSNLKKPLLDGFTGDQKSYALGLNYDVNTDSVIKVEAKRIFIPYQSRGLFSAIPGFEEAMVYRIGYSLIF